MKNEIKKLYNDWKQYMIDNSKELNNDLSHNIDLINFIDEYDFEWEYNNQIDIQELDENEISTVRMYLFDELDRQCINHNSEQFYNNLINNGFKYNYDEDKWVTPDNKNLTSYGLIWDYWYDLDTCIRESVSDVFMDNI